MFESIKKLFSKKTSDTDETQNNSVKKEEQQVYKLVSPISGKAISLSEVPDPVFAEKMAGEGLAITPSDDLVVAPADGTVVSIFPSKHAFAMKLDNGAELLIHLGLETVSLDGDGFEQIAEEGSIVKAGDPILKMNNSLIASKHLSTISPVLITNPDEFTEIHTFENIDTEAGKTCILEYCVK